jgi:hypothetical protein
MNQNNMEINVDNNELDEYEKDKLEKYRSKLGNELNDLIKLEKEKEEERLKNYNIEADDEIKRILEDSINKDRLESSRKIMSFNE